LLPDITRHGCIKGITAYTLSQLAMMQEFHVGWKRTNDLMHLVDVISLAAHLLG
jgi:hypothetical protein